MLSRNSKARRRTRRILGALIVIVIGLLLLPWAASWFIRQRAAEDATSTPSPLRASPATPGTISANTMIASPATGTCPELQQVAKDLSYEPLPPVALVYLQSFFPGHPDEPLLRKVRLELQYALSKGPLTELEKSLDPDTHSIEEIEAALCALVTRTDILPAIEAAVKASGSEHAATNYDQSMQLVYAILYRQERCGLCEGSPEEALERWIRYARISNWMFPADGIPQLGADWDTPLQELLDRFPGAVPKPFQEQLLACLLPSPNVPAMEAAAPQIAGTYDKEGNRPHVADDARDVVAHGAYVEAFYELIRPDKDNYFRRLAQPPANKGLEQCRTALTALAGIPPHQTRNTLAEIERRIPPHSTNVRAYYEQTTRLYRQAWLYTYCKDVLALVFALKEYKAAHGQYPATLDLLVPDYMGTIPISPVTGEVPAYTPDGQGFTITHPAYRSGAVAALNAPPRTLWRAEH